MKISDKPYSEEKIKKMQERPTKTKTGKKGQSEKQCKKGQRQRKARKDIRREILCLIVDMHR
jgi:hypothetical protein